MYKGNITTINVTVKRQSVCMGDDCDAPHSKVIQISIRSTLEDLLNSVSLKEYLPYVHGNEALWFMVLNNIEIASISNNGDNITYFFTHTDKVTKFLNEDGDCTLFFTYYVNSKERAKKLFFDFDGSHRWMYNDGFISEYTGYNISKETEDQWKIELEKRKNR